jgi:hypothetical protein
MKQSFPGMAAVLIEYQVHALNQSGKFLVWLEWVQLNSQFPQLSVVRIAQRRMIYSSIE